MAETSLKDKTAKGLFWGGMSNGMMQVLNAVFGICLLNLLTPSDYGMVQVLNVFSSIAACLQESGFIATLANKKNPTHEDYNAVFWFNILCGLTCYIILFFAAPFIADFYKEPQLVGLSRFVFLSFLISSFGIAQRAYLFGHLMVKQSSIISITSLLLSGISGVAMAYAGFAFWGLAAQTVVFVTVIVVMNWYYSPWRPTFTWNFRPIREMFSFSSKLLITGLFNQVNRNVLSTLLGRYYDTHITGQYGNATYVISDGEGTAELEVYRGYYLNGEKFTSKDQIKVGDEVVVVGQLTRFFETYEFTKGSKIYSINDGGSGGEDPDDPTEEPTSATPITIAEFLQKPVNNTDWYELTGEIVSIVSGNAYGNFTIKDDTGSVYIYGMVQAWAGGKNDQSFNKIGLKVGDSVTLWSLRDEHDGQPQGGGSDIPAIYKSHEEGATVTYPEGTVFLTFPDGNQKSVSSYTDTWTAICDGYTFTIANFNNNKNGWSYIKCGREKAASVATIANATAMPELSSIEVSVDNVTKASSVNSVTLTIYSDEANSSQVGEPIAWTDYSAGVWEFAIPEGVQAENLYYKLTFDCAPHGSSNGIIQISKVTYIAAE